MRNFFIFIGFIVGMIFLFMLYKTTENVVHQESIALQKTTVKTITSTSEKKPIHIPKKADVLITKNKPIHAYHISVVKNEFPKTIEKIIQNPTPPVIPKNHTTSPYHVVTTTHVTTSTQATPEAIMKYVLFSVSYEPSINVGETKSLQLKMSPRNALINLENALKNNTIPKSQINDIEKVEKKYKYVSAKLITQNNCLEIEKKMPEEDKVYLPNINESSADQVWQWDLTAPDVPLANTCHLSLFIRFCLNQDDCIPSDNPDKEFNIFIQVTLAHKIYIWITDVSNLANYGYAIITFLVALIGIAGFIWRKKRSRKKR